MKKEKSNWDIFKSFINSQQIGDVFSISDILNHENAKQNESVGHPLSSYHLYISGLMEVKILEENKENNTFKILKKIDKNISLNDFLEAVYGDGWQSWFVVVEEK